ncbi:MAG: hypothetical protein IJZ90_00875, partial [Clostridia bacterium]|nr:hypothetical protein [Clostridia bacterium]
AYHSFVDYKDVACTGIRNITSEDHIFADKLGCSIKLIARSRLVEGKVTITTEPLLLSGDNLLSSVNSVFNAVLVKGSYTGDTLFYGKGAGKLPTASAVAGDIIEILQNPNEASLPEFTEVNAVIDKSNNEKLRKLVRISSDADVADIKNALVAVFGNGVTLLDKVNDKYAFVTNPMTTCEYDSAAKVFTSAVSAVVENTINFVD